MRIHSVHWFFSLAAAGLLAGCYNLTLTQYAGDGGGQDAGAGFGSAGTGGTGGGGGRSNGRISGVGGTTGGLSGGDAGVPDVPSARPTPLWGARAAGAGSDSATGIGGVVGTGGIVGPAEPWGPAVRAFRSWPSLLGFHPAREARTAREPPPASTGPMAWRWTGRATSLSPTRQQHHPENHAFWRGDHACRDSGFGEARTARGPPHASTGPVAWRWTGRATSSSPTRQRHHPEDHAVAW